jgi:hypothetical protein
MKNRAFIMKSMLSLLFWLLTPGSWLLLLNL